MLGQRTALFALFLLTATWPDASTGASDAGGPAEIVTIQVGATDIRIPIPPGHVGGEQVPRYVWQGASKNEVFAVFIRQADALLTAQGIPTTFKTVYRVEVFKRAVNRKISRPEFDKLKASMRQGFLERHLPDLADKANEHYREKGTDELSRIIGDKIDEVIIGQPTMLGIVDESDAWISIALLNKGALEAQGRRTTYAVVNTMSMAVVKGKMLTLIVMQTYNNADDLQELLDSSRKWVRRIAKLN